MAKLYWEDITVGEEVTPFVRTTGLMEWNRFAAGNEEHFDYHMGDAAARRMGLPGVIGMGNIRFAYLHNMLERWVGEDGTIKMVGCSYRGLNVEHDTLTTWGKVTNKYVKDGEYLVDLEVGVRNQDGRETAPGRARVALPSRGS